jgi:outer membrane protein assembly factor BamB
VKLLVTVVDGDRRVRVPGATVRLWGRAARADRAGVARIHVPFRRRLAVTVSAPGFGARTLLEPFRTGRQATIRIYRDDLQWPLYGATERRTQAQSHIKLRPPFRTVWSVGLGGLIEFPAVVDDGVAYIGNGHATIRAISMRFGRVLWRHDTPHGKMASSPAVVGQELVYHSMGGDVYVLDRANGAERWRFSVGSPIESSPIVRDGVDYFGAWNGWLYALDLRTHRLRWSRDLGAKITSSASIAGGTLYIGDYAGRVWALSARTGATRWVRSVNGRVYGTPAVAGGRVFVPSSTGQSLTAFSTSGAELWRVGTGGYVYSSPAVWGGRVFFGSYDGGFYAVSAASGAVLWRVGAGGPISGAAVVVDGVAYAGSFAHEIVGVDARSGNVLLRFDHGHYVPVSGNGMRLLFHGYSRLYAVEPRSTAKNASTTRAVTRQTATHTQPLRHPRK